MATAGIQIVEKMKTMARWVSIAGGLGLIYFGVMLSPYPGFDDALNGETHEARAQKKSLGIKTWLTVTVAGLAVAGCVKLAEVSMGKSNEANAD